MTARRRSAALVVAAALIAALTWWVAAPAPSPLREGNFGLVKSGMTQAEVEDLLGAPPGDYGTRSDLWQIEFYREFPTYPSRAEWPGVTMQDWYAEGRFIRVWFDARGYTTATNDCRIRRVFAPDLLERSWRRLIGKPRCMTLGTGLG